MNKYATLTQDAEGPLRKSIRQNYKADEGDVLRALVDHINLSEAERQEIAAAGARYVDRVRKETSPSMMEAFLAEYGLSTEEGVGLMCLAEALLRVPDAETIDELIHDKIEPSDWGAHLGHCASSDNLGHQSVLSFGGSGSSLIKFMRFQFRGASAA